MVIDGKRQEDVVHGMNRKVARGKRKNHRRETD